VAAAGWRFAPLPLQVDKRDVRLSVGMVRRMSPNGDGSISIVGAVALGAIVGIASCHGGIERTGGRISSPRCLGFDGSRNGMRCAAASPGGCG
jgi:hypothetical protein